MSKVTFQLNDPEKFALTTAQLSTIHALTIFAEAEQDTQHLSFDIVEGDNPKRPHVKFIVNHAGTTFPVRYWIDPDGTIGMSEEMDWVEEDGDDERPES